MFGIIDQPIGKAINYIAIISHNLKFVILIGVSQVSPLTLHGVDYISDFIGFCDEIHQ